MSNHDAANGSGLFLPTATAQQRETMTTRDEVVNKWCAENGVVREDITIEQLFEIRALPEWKSAS